MPLACDDDDDNDNDVFIGLVVKSTSKDTNQFVIQRGGCDSENEKTENGVEPDGLK